MKIQKKDIIPVSIIGAGAIAFSYLFFGTDIFIEHEVIETAQAPIDNGLQNFNLAVTEKPIDAYDDNKLLAYDAELEKEKADANAKLQSSYSSTIAGPSVNDLSELITSTTESPQQPAPSAEATPQDFNRPVKTAADRMTTTPVTGPGDPSKARTKSAGSAKKKQPTTTIISSEPIEPVALKKRRRGDPEFGSSQPAAARDSSSRTPSTKGLYTAIIHGRQTVIDGARVTLRLTSPFSGPCQLPSNSMLSGIATFSGHRLEIAVTVCQKDGSPTKLIAYDATDGLAGLYVEGLNTGQELKKEAIDDAVGQAVSDLGVPVVDKVIRSATSKKLSNTSVNLESGRTLYLTLKEK